MKARAFDAMGTSWWVACDAPHLLSDAEAVVRDAESRLSRFAPRSALSRLNRERISDDALLVDVLRAALRLRELTGGAFDPAVGGRLSALGYDRTFSALTGPTQVTETPPATLRVTFWRGGVRVEGEGALDLGGIAKGFTVDRVLGRLRDGGAHRALVDGGGDIRGFGAGWPIGVGEGLVVRSDAGAVATSSTRARRWSSSGGRPLHHLVSPVTGWPTTSGFETAVVIAADAATADGLATAALVDPAGVLPRLAALGAHALLADDRGNWWTTPGAPLEGGPPSQRHRRGDAGSLSRRSTTPRPREVRQ